MLNNFQFFFYRNRWFKKFSHNYISLYFETNNEIIFERDVLYLWQNYLFNLVVLIVNKQLAQQQFHILFQLVPQILLLLK
jgi:hypothetical protein